MSILDMNEEQRKIYCRNIARKKVMDKLKLIRKLREMR